MKITQYIINYFVKITFVTFIVLGSCKNSKNMMPLLSFKPLPGKIYNYKITEEKAIDQDFGSGNIHSSIIKSIVLTYESVKSPTKDYNILGHLNSYNIKNYNKITPNFSLSPNFHRSENRTSELQDDSSSDQNPIDIFGGTNFKLSIDNLGNIVKFDGYSKLRMKINNQSNQANYDHNFEKVYNEAFFKSLFEKSLIVFSEEFNNMDWSSSDSIDLLQGALKFENTYKIAKIDDRIVYIKTFGKLDQDVVIPGNLKIRMKGENIGTIQIEKSSGMLLKRESKVFIEGALKTDNRILTQKLKITTGVERKNYEENKINKVR